MTEIQKPKRKYDLNVGKRTKEDTLANFLRIKMIYI